MIGTFGGFFFRIFEIGLGIKAGNIELLLRVRSTINAFQCSPVKELRNTSDLGSGFHVWRVYVFMT